MSKALTGIVEGQLSDARQDLLIFRRPFGLFRLTIPMNRLEVIPPTDASRSLSLPSTYIRHPNVNIRNASVSCSHRSLGETSGTRRR